MLPDLWLVRHGATQWSDEGRHTGTTDVPLTAEGRQRAAALQSPLTAHHFARVLTSPLQRARETAARAGFEDAIVDNDLREWDYGELEGLTTEEIRARGGDWQSWTIWHGSVPGGETIEQVSARMRSVLDRLNAIPGDVLLFGHGHSLRVLTSIALNLDPHWGACFALGAATINVIGSEHDWRALRFWNARGESVVDG
ncbi:MAG TPA: histidine phosphatase family protein [Acidimicrobiia bacterium]|nr:histidine phosphatase family protein [Acidimicrobiia bacterium]